MVEEIIYTSAEKGLKQGSRGFCTVISTNGMALNLAERLESMSGYRQAFPLHDPKASLNPVCWSHMTTRLAGRSLHVISRVADAGQDYTGRSNKLAHHLVIDNVASLVSGPARMLAEPGVVADRWDGTVRHIPPRDLRSAPMPATIPLVAWKALTGDEGWAGSVAEQLLQSPAPVSIIFDPGTDTLTLVREVLDLVPAAQRWNVTFTTYFTRLLAGAECQLRFVLNDTPEATSLRNDARARVIDLTSSLPAATGGTLVAMARQGQLTPQEVAPPQAATAARPRAITEFSTKDTGSEISPPKLKSGRSTLEPTDRLHSPPEFGASPGRGSKKGVWIGVAIALMFVIGTGTLIFLRPRGGNDPFADLVSKTVPQDQPPTEAEKEPARAREQAEKDSGDQKERERPEQLAADEAAKKKAAEKKLAETKWAAQQEAERIRQETMQAQAKAAREAALKAEGPFAFIKDNPHFQDKWGQWLLALPKPGELPNDPHWPQLRVNGDPIQLSLWEGALPLFAGSSYQLNLRQNPMDLNEWVVEATAAGTVVPIAKYAVVDLSRDPTKPDEPDRELQFEWLLDARRETMAAELLRWRPLKIQVGERKAVLVQRNEETPETAEGQPTWKSILASKDIPVINTDAIKAVSFEKAKTAKFTLEIAQEGQETEIIELPILPTVAAEEDPDSDTATSPNTTVRYFTLTTPIEFMDTRPEVTDDLVGFGEIRLAVSQPGTTGLTLKPTVILTLRLPQEDDLDSLPDESTNQGLKDIAKTPTLLAQWNPELAEGAIKNLQNTRAGVRNNIEKWYTQAMKPLPPKEKFQSTTFDNLAKNAVQKVKGIVPSCEKELQAATSANKRLKDMPSAFATYQEQLRIAQLRESQASSNLQLAQTQHKPIIAPFTAAMQKMSGEMKITNAELIKDYDAIADRINECLKVIEQVHIRCMLSGDVETEECDTGSKVSVHFLETTSPNWPEVTTQPEAK